MKSVMKFFTYFSFIALVCLALALILGSCSRNYCAKKFPQSTKDSFIYIDRIVLKTIKLPGDTVNILIPINCPDQEIKSENSKQKIDLVIKDGILIGKFICKEDSLQNVITELQKSQYKNSQKTTPIETKYIPWYVKSYLYFVSILALYLLIFGNGLIKKLWKII